MKLDELEKLYSLKEKGIITEEQFNEKKKQILDSLKAKNHQFQEILSKENISKISDIKASTKTFASKIFIIVLSLLSLVSLIVFAMLSLFTNFYSNIEIIFLTCFLVIFNFSIMYILKKILKKECKYRNYISKVILILLITSIWFSIGIVSFFINDTFKTGVSAHKYFSILIPIAVIAISKIIYNKMLDNNSGFLSIVKNYKKASIFTILLIILAISADIYGYMSNNGVQREYYSDGVLKKEMTLKGGKENGSYKEYYADGKLKLEKSMKNGEEDGFHKEYYADGKLKLEINYNHPYNEVKGYYQTGNLHFEGECKKINTYYTDEFYQICYLRDKGNVGVWKTYFENGKLEKVYDENDIIFICEQNGEFRYNSKSYSWIKDYSDKIKKFCNGEKIEIIWQKK